MTVRTNEDVLQAAVSAAAVMQVFFWGTVFRPSSSPPRRCRRLLRARARSGGIVPPRESVGLTRGQLPRGRPLALAAISGLLMVTPTYQGIAEGTRSPAPGTARRW